jgi:hypothetical protein
MRASGVHIKNVRAVIADRLLLAGFARRRKPDDIFAKPLTHEVSAWVGVNTRTQKTAEGEVGVRPMMGVRHEPIMRVYEQVSPLMDLEQSPTITTGLADLLGNAALEWHFPAGDDPGPVADDMVASVERVGVAWCAAHVTPAAMRDAVLNRRAFGVTHSNEQILPLLDLLCGEHNSASERLRASLNARGDRTDDEAVEFGTFARNLLRHIESLGTDGQPPKA